MTVADLREHVEKIAADNGIRLVEHQGRAHAHTYAAQSLGPDGGTCRTCGTIAHGELVARIRPIRSTRSYIVALHEIGHLLGRHQTHRKWSRLEREVDATYWAWLHTRTASTIALDECSHLSIGYIERYPSWPRPPAGSFAWSQIANMGRRPTARDRKDYTR